MRVDFTSALWITLVMATLETVTAVSDQRCEKLNATCSMQNGIRVVDTGQKEEWIVCNPETSDMGDTFVWSVNKSDGTTKRLTDMNKYTTTNEGRMLTVKNIVVDDEGLYYCQRIRSGNSLPEPEQLPGACLYVFGPAQFGTCGTGSNMQTPQEGCLSGPEVLMVTTEYPSVTFNISVVHENRENYCFLQKILALTFKSINQDFQIRCNNEDCENADRFTHSRSVNGEFDINLTLHEPNKNDSGTYMLTANIRDPSTNTGKYIYKNFTLMVKDPTTTVSTEEPTISSSLSNGGLDPLPSAVVITVSVIAALALLLFVLTGVGVFLCLWTFHKKPKDSIYDQPKKARNGILNAVDDKRSSVVSFNEHESVMLADTLNSPAEEC